MGLKENVIVGRLIPAGTGGVMNKKRAIAVQRDQEVLERNQARLASEEAAAAEPEPEAEEASAETFEQGATA